MDEIEIGDNEEEITIDAYCKQAYQNIFWPRDNQSWRIDACFADGYYEASKSIVEGILRGTLYEGIEGVAALFLFRHYLEIRLKLLIFHARWLSDWEHNAPDDEVQAVAKTHSLEKLWDQAQNECKSRIPLNIWNSFDIEFVGQCIKEFHLTDPNGECFRYPTERIQVQRNEPYKNPMGISYHSLFNVMQHVYSVLEWIDSYLLNKHGENEEWEEILNSY